MHSPLIHLHTAPQQQKHNESVSLQDCWQMQGVLGATAGVKAAHGG
jgi:hypothetical protein